MNSIYLKHTGVPGMKWGVRRFQNKDGSLTPLGKKKYGDKENFNKMQADKRIKSKTEKYKKADSEHQKQKVLKDMSDDEIDIMTKRLRAEKDLIEAKNDRIRSVNTYKQLISKPKKPSIVNKLLSTAVMDIVAPASVDIGRQLVKSKMSEWTNTSLGYEDKNVDYAIYPNNKRKDK